MADEKFKGYPHPIIICDGDLVTPNEQGVWTLLCKDGEIPLSETTYLEALGEALEILGGRVVNDGSLERKH